jgi:hypothetical protein
MIIFEFDMTKRSVRKRRYDSKPRGNEFISPPDAKSVLNKAWVRFYSHLGFSWKRVVWFISIVLFVLSTVAVALIGIDQVLISAENLWNRFVGKGTDFTHSGVEPVLIEDNRASPTKFALSDQNIALVAPFDLRKGAGQTATLGDFPNKPSVRVRIMSIDLLDSVPKASISVGVNLEGVFASERGIGFNVALVRGRGFRMQGQPYDVVFEITDDKVSTISGWLAVTKGTGDSEGVTTNVF